MKNITMKVSLYAAAAFALSAVPGFAQQTGRVSVKVPFEFTAGGSVLPAGEYNFQETQNGVLSISSANQHKSVMVLTNPETAPAVNTQAAVKFDKVGEQYSLSEISMVGEPSRKLLHFERDAATTTLATKLGVTNAASKGLKK